MNTNNREMKKLFLTLVLIIICLGGHAQRLVVYDASDLVDKKSDAHFAVLTEQYCQSDDWGNLQDRIFSALEAKYTGASGLSVPAMVRAVTSHAVGGRLYYSAEVLENPLFARVRVKSWEEAKSNAWGVINADGQTIVPFRYETIGSYGNIIIASRKVNPDKGLWEIRLYSQDGSLASDQTFIQAFDIFNVFSQENTVCVHFSDGGWGLIDGNGRVITNKKYDEMGTGDRIFYEKIITDVWGKRNGKMYLVSPVTGQETGTFTYTFRSRENHFKGVKIIWY